MNTSNEKFPQQDAPEKNTDRAFVQVGADGQPVMPQTANDDNVTKEDTVVKENEKQ
ncbi:MAG TPA: hypothetical protein VEY10_04150 [Flavisolibacter sp.]|jgi:hypothetical protein|nr:hypothetical protein [Flavisolibacter sp.]